MDAKELRIGNWILDHEADPKKTIYYQVEEIQRLSNNKALNQTLGVTYRKGSCWTCDVEPIPLTEEWWVRFGAELKKVVGMDNEYNLKLGEVEISWDKKTGVTVFVLDTLESFRVSYIKYVHQFQNFCFALTNEELTIKI